jgi:ferredoxin
MKKMKIVINRNLCQSAATCAAIAPKVYELDREYKAIVVKRDPVMRGEKYSYIVEADDKKIQEAIEGAKSCPFQAIEIFNEDGKKIS